MPPLRLAAVRRSWPLLVPLRDRRSAAVTPGT